jgi:hypothetical protein
VLDKRRAWPGISHPQAVVFVLEWCQGNLQRVRSSRLGVCFGIDDMPNTVHPLSNADHVQVTVSRVVVPLLSYLQANLLCEFYYMSFMCVCTVQMILCYDK